MKIKHRIIDEYAPKRCFFLLKKLINYALTWARPTLFIYLFVCRCLLACFQWLSWKYRLNLLRHVVFIKENLFLIQKLFILRLLDTIGSHIAFFLNFYRNLPQYRLFISKTILVKRNNILKGYCLPAA
jgi:hypothetical protein